MTKSHFQPLVKTSGFDGLVADRSAVTEVLEADEIKQIKVVTDEENRLDESLNGDAAIEEQDDELEEQHRVEAAAAANRG